LGFGRFLAGNWLHFCLFPANLEKSGWEKPGSRRKKDVFTDLKRKFIGWISGMK